MESDIAKAMMSMGSGGVVAATLLYFYRGKAAELAEARARIEALQDRIVAMLQAQLESEPARRETLAGLKRLVEDQSAALKERALQ